MPGECLMSEAECVMSEAECLNESVSEDRGPFSELSSPSISIYRFGQKVRNLH